ncbi:response regulator transcription factor [Roseateles sp. NT4]|uniref:response regulator transcription factor n=1 Tax=Roseateles sp. NT4 TaxID=3453715 RepID=UPI003EE87E20
MSCVRAFLVENSPVIRENLAGTLEELANVEVIGSAADEESAVHWMSRESARKADIVIVDIFLNSGSGLGVLQAAQRLGVSARRIVLTNYATDDVRRRCARLGAERVFDKCRDLEALISYCADLADGSVVNGLDLPAGGR